MLTAASTHPLAPAALIALGCLVAKASERIAGWAISVRIGRGKA